MSPLKPLKTFQGFQRDNERPYPWSFDLLAQGQEVGPAFQWWERKTCLPFPILKWPRFRGHVVFFYGGVGVVKSRRFWWDGVGEGYNLKSVYPGTCTWCVSKKGSVFSAPKVTSFICRIWKCQHWQNARVSEKGRRVRSLLYTVCTYWRGASLVLPHVTTGSLF